ncbi:S-adenosylmethionine-dependent nucleotide dehydratase RSAD2-like [Anabrus simplex]|uniref:S-adenosylmethionine-dependent nucleotide dehydratase RSAD2-like n=1 Tax=Anabrus simplex TaxID=316456 RepID=UPI0034DD1923
MPLMEAKKGLKMLKEAGMEKVNFSGGEPFITQNGRYLGELVRYCKEELHLPSVSIVSNGSLIREKWFRDYGEYLDILAISCDSFDEETNREIGRGQGNRNHVQKLLKIYEWCREYHVAFKINTVVNTKNVDEDMSENIMSLNPIRWKVFQCLLLEGENVGKDALRHAEKFYISDDQFQEFLDRHKHVPMLVSESNTKMQNSYLILDEYMRFLDCREGAKKPSPSLLDVGVANALDQSGFDEAMFRKRGGEYKWSKADMLLDW